MIGLASFRLHEVCLIRRSEEVCERRNIVGSHMNACVILGKKYFNNQYYIVFYENQVKQSILYKQFFRFHYLSRLAMIIPKDQITGTTVSGGFIKFNHVN